MSFRIVQFHNLPYPESEKVGSQRRVYLQVRIECSFRNYFNPICDRFDEKTKRDYCFLGKSETILAVIFVIPNRTSPVPKRVRKLTARGVHICK